MGEIKRIDAPTPNRNMVGLRPRNPANASYWELGGKVSFMIGARKSQFWGRSGGREGARNVPIVGSSFVIAKDGLQGQGGLVR